MSEIGCIPFKTRDGPPPTKFLEQTRYGKVHLWFITPDEYNRLNHIFGREFQECNVGATRVVGLPTPCEGCGKYTEFIDWVWTAVKRGVHSSDFMFESLRDHKQPQENMHDVYCSGCGLLTKCRSRNNAEGGQPNIELAGFLDRTNYPAPPPRPEVPGAEKKSVVNTDKKMDKVVMWGEWWLDDSGSVASWRAARNAAATATA